VNAPTDLELMLFHDGELDEPRRSEVASWLEQSSTGRTKLAGLSLGGDLLRDASMQRARDFDVTAAVMAGIAATNGTAPAEGGAKVIRLEPKPKAAPADASKPVSQDGGRLLLPLTALAAAAAAALFFWGKAEPTGTGTEPVAKTDASEEAPPVQPLPPTPAPSAPSMLGSAPEAEDPEPSVQVASVDFGSRLGAVYYVGDAPSGATTTVVWVTEE
jgi:hypothetical protein